MILAALNFDFSLDFQLSIFNHFREKRKTFISFYKKFAQFENCFIFATITNF